MIENIEDYFSKGCGRCARFATADCATRKWQAGLSELRKLCLAAGLEETVKWGHPCYVSGGRNVAIIGALRDDFRLSFFNPALMRDEHGVLGKQGPNTQHKGTMRFAANDQVAALSPVIAAYLSEAKAYAEAGIKPPRTAAEIDLPEEMIEALDSDPELSEAFAALTPGRQRSYAIALNSAKAASTRMARIAKLRPRILAGKGAQER